MCLQSKSMIAATVPQTLCICDNSAFIITLKSGSICRKSIHFISPVPRTEGLWIFGDANNEQEFSLLKQLLARKLSSHQVVPRIGTERELLSTMYIHICKITRSMGVLNQLRKLSTTVCRFVTRFILVRVHCAQNQMLDGKSA